MVMSGTDGAGALWALSIIIGVPYVGVTSVLIGHSFWWGLLAPALVIGGDILIHLAAARFASGSETNDDGQGDKFRVGGKETPLNYTRRVTPTMPADATWLPVLGIALVVAWVGLAAALERRKALQRARPKE